MVAFARDVRFPSALWRTPQRAAPWVISAAATTGCAAYAAVVALLVVHAPALAIAAVAVPVVVLTAFLRPTATVVAGLVAASIYQGVYLHWRFEVLGVPVSAFDLVPPLLFVAALAIRSQTAAPGRAPAVLYVSVGLLLAGFLLGTLVGLSNHAPQYQLLRVVRLEAGLLVALAAAALAGHLPQWRHAVRRGLVVAGAAVAVQLVVSFWWIYLTGRSFWAMFPFGVGGGDVPAQLLLGDLNVLRTQGVPTYLMLPLLGLVGVRMRGRDAVMAALIIVAGATSLSRGFYAALAAMLLLILLVRSPGSRSTRFARFVRWAPLLAAAAAVLSVSIGDVLSQRLQQAVTLQDQSAFFRRSESAAALHALARSPATVVLGTGAGVVIEHAGLADPTRAQGDETSLLENSVLARWTNLTLLSLLGTAVMLLAASRRGWRPRTSRISIDTELGMMGLALPILLAGGLVGGTLVSPQGTLPFWLLAGTLLATRTTRPERAR